MRVTRTVMSLATPRCLLIVSIVLFYPEPTRLLETLSSLRRAKARLRSATRLVIVDNGGAAQAVDRLRLCRDFPGHVWLSGQGNIGFGAGHNLALRSSGARYALVLNPDVWMDDDSLVEAIEFMERNVNCALLSPGVCEGDGARQYLCKRYPSVFDLFLRGLAPGWLRRRFHRRLARYEMRDLIGEHIVWDPPLVSGCFMLFRAGVFERIGGFDERFFLYFEDFDISLRTSRQNRIAYVPQVRIMHYGGQAARKGWRHIGLFMRSAALFFRIHRRKWL
ncbi:MAG: glycosyltransferase family 2 protein [Rhodocyclaceae bacterium]